MSQEQVLRYKLSKILGLMLFFYQRERIVRESGIS